MPLDISYLAGEGYSGKSFIMDHEPTTYIRKKDKMPI